ncbi:4-hydroxy-3-methylbut-2-enyl diphosphate reductase [Fervidobacterium changbaicum]|uniref:4-hydroxy-3-methylbut-2-enyl diphosphate reductase n=2 Tax=Fervidobacterium TaxID=2422 RepID=A0AAI8CMS8_FERIS|nr:MULTISPECIES: 4-hydroxy-3-methylbut-2-enyl diphosphate reductase [Fervidobacterium]AMW33431.1 4-hydroxy-3-methylbut-2-enyl diphosphate reductase [Fervidobacterium islandicum]QAV33479.1 4-hydroxy-3-methylbut-2-enyl diphosphate reductase [Fervidobacterium changbaicum]SDH14719.1 4-hydroxy-3-methylbut-2-enyl diphosphate reductase [Fervidobacterium changbaicum]
MPEIFIGPVGFCFGVERAVEKVEQLLREGRSVLTDGEIVHNKNVMLHLKELGLKTQDNVSSVGEIFAVRAHGLPPKTIKELSQQFKIVDLTCPIVLNVFKLAEKLRSDGFRIVAYGNPQHAEMVALKGHVEDSIITKTPVRLEPGKWAVISQTTSSKEGYEKFIELMKTLNPDCQIVSYNTICNVTIEREKFAKVFGEKCDLVIVVGGKNSSNTKKLYEIAYQQGNAKAIHIEDLEEFKHVISTDAELLETLSSSSSKIGILSGTSTSNSDVSNIVKYILEKYGGRELFMAEFEKLNNAVQEGQENFEESKENLEPSFEELLNESEKAMEQNRVGKGRVVEGTVTEVTPTGLNVDFGWKGTGVVPLEELYRDLSEYKVGQKILVRIEKFNEEEGTAILSEKKPMQRKVMEDILNAFNEGKTVTGRILERIKGGYRVLLENVVEAFLPGSESNLKEGEELPREKMHFAVINFEQRGRKTNIVVSRKKLFQKLVEEFFQTKKQGDVVEGIVENIDERGAFVKIGGVLTGFLPNQEVSYNTNAKASDVLSVGKTVKLQIKEIDPTRKRITLSLKALMPDPWENVTKKFQVGQQVTGIVTSIKPFGFFAKIDDGIEGLVPISEIFWGKPGKVTDVVAVGDAVKLQILEIVPEKRRILLSYKSVEGNPWDKVAEKYPEGSIATGKVVKVLPNGVIVELEPNITGFCNISEICWNFVDKIEEVVKEGEQVKFQILSIDKENKKIKVSIRRAKENPWEKFAKNHKEGDTVSAKIIKVLDKGYIGLCEGVEVYIPKTQVYETLNIGDEVSGKIIKLEPQKDIYKIIVSPKAHDDEIALKTAKDEEQKGTAQVSMEGKLENAVESEEPERGASKD